MKLYSIQDIYYQRHTIIEEILNPLNTTNEYTSRMYCLFNDLKTEFTNGFQLKEYYKNLFTQNPKTILQELSNESEGNNLSLQFGLWIFLISIFCFFVSFILSMYFRISNKNKKQQNKTTKKLCLQLLMNYLQLSITIIISGIIIFMSVIDLHEYIIEDIQSFLLLCGVCYLLLHLMEWFIEIHMISFFVLSPILFIFSYLLLICSWKLHTPTLIFVTLGIISLVTMISEMFSSNKNMLRVFTSAVYIAVMSSVLSSIPINKPIIEFNQQPFIYELYIVLNSFAIINSIASKTQTEDEF